MGLLVAAALSTLSSRSVLAGAVRTDGTAVALGSGGSHPVIEFTPAGGEATQFGGSGLIWRTRACATPELTHDDFCGPAVFVAGGGAIIAVADAADVMLLGFDKLAYAEAVATRSVPLVGTLMTERACPRGRRCWLFLALCAGCAISYEQVMKRPARLGPPHVE